MSKMTYLVHIHLAPREPGVALPAHTASTIATAANHPRVLHAVTHPLAEPHPVVGLYLQEATLDEAEAAARCIWQCALVTQPWLGQWQLVRAEVPLLGAAPWAGPPWDRLS